MYIETENILGFNVSNFDSSNLITQIYEKSILSSQKKVVACLNPHSFAISLDDKFFCFALKSADWLIPDGVGIVLASKMLGGSIRKRFTGYDLFYSLSKRLNFKDNPRVFFLGSSDRVLGKIQNRLKSDFPNILVDCYSPPFKNNFTSLENRLMVRKINKFSPDILWVGMTAPKQEKWIAYNIKHLNVKLAAGIGAVFDFYAGEKKRPTPIIQNLGLEWLFRLICEPRRLWRRTFVSSFIFFKNLFFECLR